MEDFFFQVAVEGGAKAFLKTLRGSHPFYSRVPLLEESHLFPRVVNKYIRKLLFYFNPITPTVMLTLISFCWNILEQHSGQSTKVKDMYIII